MNEEFTYLGKPITQIKSLEFKYLYVEFGEL